MSAASELPIHNIWSPPYEPIQVRLSTVFPVHTIPSMRDGVYFRKVENFVSVPTPAPLLL
jgi:hypothetical protein